MKRSKFLLAASVVGLFSSQVNTAFAAQSLNEDNNIDLDANNSSGNLFLQSDNTASEESAKDSKEESIETEEKVENANNENSGEDKAEDESVDSNLNKTENKSESNDTSTTDDNANTENSQENTPDNSAVIDLKPGEKVGDLTFQGSDRDFVYVSAKSKEPGIVNRLLGTNFTEHQELVVLIAVPITSITAIGIPLSLWLKGKSAEDLAKIPGAKVAAKADGDSKVYTNADKNSNIRTYVLLAFGAVGILLTIIYYVKKDPPPAGGISIKNYNKIVVITKSDGGIAEEQVKDIEEFVFKAIKMDFEAKGGKENEKENKSKESISGLFKTLLTKENTKASANSALLKALNKGETNLSLKQLDYFITTFFDVSGDGVKKAIIDKAFEFSVTSLGNEEQKQWTIIVKKLIGNSKTLTENAFELKIKNSKSPSEISFFVKEFSNETYNFHQALKNKNDVIEKLKNAKDVNGLDIIYSLDIKNKNDGTEEANKEIYSKMKEDFEFVDKCPDSDKLLENFSDNIECNKMVENTKELLSDLEHAITVKEFKEIKPKGSCGKRALEIFETTEKIIEEIEKAKSKKELKEISSRKENTLNSLPEEVKCGIIDCALEGKKKLFTKIDEAVTKNGNVDKSCIRNDEHLDKGAEEYIKKLDEMKDDKRLLGAMISYYCDIGSGENYCIKYEHAKNNEKDKLTFNIGQFFNSDKNCYKKKGEMKNFCITKDNSNNEEYNVKTNKKNSSLAGYNSENAIENDKLLLLFDKEIVNNFIAKELNKQNNLELVFNDTSNVCNIPVEDKKLKIIGESSSSPYNIIEKESKNTKYSSGIYFLKGEGFSDKEDNVTENFAGAILPSGNSSLGKLIMLYNSMLSTNYHIVAEYAKEDDKKDETYPYEVGNWKIVKIKDFEKAKQNNAVQKIADVIFKKHKITDNDKFLRELIYKDIIANMENEREVLFDSDEIPNISGKLKIEPYIKKTDKTKSCNAITVRKVDNKYKFFYNEDYAAYMKNIEKLNKPS